MECIFPRKPVYGIPEMVCGMDDEGSAYLGFDNATEWDMWIVQNELRAVNKHGFVEDATFRADTTEIEVYSHRVRTWLAFALKHGFLSGLFAFWECECGDAHLTAVEFDDDAILVEPECENVDCESDQAVELVEVLFFNKMPHFLMEDWGPKRVEKNGGEVWRLHEMQWHEDYAEAGYELPEDSPGIITGNWNPVTKYNRETNRFETIDDTPALLRKFFEEMGFVLEWCDEWATCEGCSKLIRTSPDSYCWQPSYFFAEGDGYYCRECMDVEEVFESLEGQSANALNMLDPPDPTDHGYTLLESGFEHGFHPGQDADPAVIAKSLSEFGVKRFLFMIDDVMQFDMKFSLYVHKSEFENIDPEKWENMDKDGPSVSEGLKRALQNASLQAPENGGVMVTHATPDGATTVEVSCEDFADGRAMDIAKRAHEETENTEE